MENQAESKSPGTRERIDKLEAFLLRIGQVFEEAGFSSLQTLEETRGDIPHVRRDLTPREWQILRQLMRGGRVPAIAKVLEISPHTVRNHLKSIFRKFGVKSQKELLEALSSQVTTSRDRKAEG